MEWSGTCLANPTDSLLRLHFIANLSLSCPPLPAHVPAQQEELDPGVVAARGVPLSVLLLSPLWVVNASNLAIDAAIVQVPPPLPVGGLGLGQGRAGLGEICIYQAWHPFSNHNTR